MTDRNAIQDFNVSRSDSWIRLRTLLTLRWMAVAGQLVAILVAHFTIGLKLPLELCFATVSAALWFNVASTMIHPAFKRLSEREAMLSMMFDVVQLSVLLGLTGGLNNPFVLLLLTPVAISAAILTMRSTVVLGAVVLAAASILAFYNQPIILRSGEVFMLPELYIEGLWVSMAVAVVFLSIYARRVTEEIHAMNLALSAAHASLERERRLDAIGGLAAAAAHELGTPLATIKLASTELAQELAHLPEAHEDLELIRKQANRCREILADLSRGGRDDAHIKLAPVSAVIEEAAEPHAARGKEIALRIRGRPAGDVGDEQPTIRRDPEIVHGIRNFVQNAVGFAKSTVWIDIDDNESALTISISDDGPGFPEDLIDRLGDPYVTTRGRGARLVSAAASQRDGGYQGMGLGLFIAKTLLERTGASVSFSNADGPRDHRRLRPSSTAKADTPTGAVVKVAWPLDRLVASKLESRKPLGINLPFR